MLNVCVNKKSEYKKKIKKLLKYLNSKEFSNDDLMFNAELVLAELISNVIKHDNSKAEVVLDIDEDDNMLVITVFGSKGFDSYDVTLPSHTSEGGRGLFLVKQISHRLKFFDDGKIVEAMLKI